MEDYAIKIGNHKALDGRKGILVKSDDFWEGVDTFFWGVSSDNYAGVGDENYFVLYSTILDGKLERMFVGPVVVHENPENNLVKMAIQRAEEIAEGRKIINELDKELLKF